jgi:hypothetical protein
MEHALFRQFQDGRKLGKAIGARWFKRHARALYREQYPNRVTQDPLSRRLTYAEFKFSNGWFQLFRKRWGIANRCRTKATQKPPENFRETVQSWLQYNRRQTVLEETSEKGLPCGEDTPVVGRFKLSEIANMDQTPLAFEFLSSKTYDCKGAKTIWLKEQRSG